MDEAKELKELLKIIPIDPENKQIIIPNETRPPMAQRNAYERNENKNEKYKRL